MSVPLLALFKVLQNASRQRETTKDTLGEMFQKGFRPRAGATGMEAPMSGVGGFLQSFLGGGPDIDYSQFEGPPALVGGPRGSVQRIGDQGRGVVEEAVPGEAPKQFADPHIEQGKLVQVDPETHERRVLGDAPADAGAFVRFFEISGRIYGVRSDGSTKEILSAPSEEAEIEGGDIEVGEGNELGLDPGRYRKKGAGFVRIGGPKAAEPRPAGDVEAARQAWVNLDKALEDEELDDQQRQRLESLRNELVMAFPAIAREGLRVPDSAGAAGAVGRVDAAGASPDQPGALDTAVRTVMDIVADIYETLRSLSTSRTRSLTGK